MILWCHQIGGSKKLVVGDLLDTVNSIFNVGICESKITTLKYSSKLKKVPPDSAFSSNHNENEGSVAFCCPHLHCLTYKHIYLGRIFQ